MRVRVSPGALVFFEGHLAQPVRALRLHRRGRGFESLSVHRMEKENHLNLEPEIRLIGALYNSKTNGKCVLVLEPDQACQLMGFEVNGNNVKKAANTINKILPVLFSPILKPGTGLVGWSYSPARLKLRSIDTLEEKQDVRRYNIFPRRQTEDCLRTNPKFKAVFKQVYSNGRVSYRRIY